jgi:hypothetical protein
MKDYPILFSGEMVRAILEGRKTQTRRVMKPQPSLDFSPIAVEWYAPTVVGSGGEEQPGAEIFGVYGDEEGYRCPYGASGDRLYVRETWATKPDYDNVPLKDAGFYDADPIFYRATDVDYGFGVVGKWRPSIHMPRWASRITLEIIRVRVERVQDMNLGDCFAEGLTVEQVLNLSRGQKPSDIINAYATLWNSINDDRGFGWKVNPWVWVFEFKRVTA